MTSPTILITGSTSGIGRAAAATLVQRGAKLIIHGRSARRVAQAVRELGGLAPGAEVNGVVADLSRRAEVESLAREVAASAERLDVLIHNAAVVPLGREVTVDGFEMQFFVNHLAPFLLTHRLAALLVRSAPARVVVVASQLEREGRLDLTDLQSEHAYDANKVYATTKLANVLFATELARRLAGTGVTANSLHPGIAGTNVLNALGGKPRWLAPWTRYRQPSPDVATATIIRLALDPELAAVTGSYFREEAPAEPTPQARDPELARRLWLASAELLGLPPDLAST